MDWQLFLTGAVVAAAAAYIGRRTWRTWTAQGCGGCGCANKPAAGSTGPALIPSESLTLRVRPRP